MRIPKHVHFYHKSTLELVKKNILLDINLRIELKNSLESESEFADASDNSATLTKAAASLFTDSKSYLG